MFYSYELLCRKPNGRFTVIWLLANSRKVASREIMKISIPDIVNDVQDFIVRKYPDHLPESYGNRFSLYLSTKLCYGIVLALRIQLSIFTNELSMLSLYMTPRDSEGSRRGRHDVRAGPDGEPHIKRQRMPEPPSQVEIDPATANAVLEDLGIDLLDHLEVNGAAVRVPEERITLRDEVEPDQLLRMESQGFGEISAADLERYVQPQDRRHQKRKVPFQDVQTRISTEDMKAQTQSWGYTMRVQNATEDRLNIDQHRFIIPAKMLLGTLRNQLLPDELKNLFERHTHPHEMPDESLEEESCIQQPGTSSSSALSLSAEGFLLSYTGLGVRPEKSPVPAYVLETITEGAEIEAEVEQVPHDVIATELRLEEGPLEQPVPEDTSTVQSHEKPDIQYVTHVQEMSNLKRSEQQLELDVKTMIQKLQPLWDEGVQVTFSLICPPGSTDRITAMITFELLLYMHHQNVVLLRQNLQICPPVIPREPVIIHSVH
ncbi:uncharacterized protein LOC111863446 [Cryptotermes secundus]|uniref:uncharacterized protein LOC111863446 n=1 Tax=Cryptotermes secundus TaxID=105785 RepID=UPI000CD7DD1C|nr:uncharacterized protein LOC111863446 [Cryptotermes secundus]